MGFFGGVILGFVLSGGFCVYLLIGGSVPSDVKYVWSVIRSIPLAGCTALFLWVFLRGGGGGGGVDGFCCGVLFCFFRRAILGFVLSVCFLFIFIFCQGYLFFVHCFFWGVRSMKKML